MQRAPSLSSLSISTRLGLGFGCMLVLLLAIAAVGQWSGSRVHEQMQQITGTGAAKARLLSSMRESVSAMGIQSRSAAMLNDIDPKQAHEQVEAVGKTLKSYAQLEATLAQTLSHKPPHWPTRRRAARAPWAACWSCWPLHWAR